MWLLLLSARNVAFAGSATWRHSPPQRQWQVATSWTPETVPNGPNDTATFTVSISDPSIFGVDIEVNGIVFDPGASDFTINVVPNTQQAASLTFSGAGIANNSGITQDFTLYTDGYTNGTISFTNSATAGSLTTFFNYGGYNSANGAVTQFFESSTAGGGIFTNLGGINLSSGTTQFFDNSTAANGTFTNYGNVLGGTTQFFDNSTAANGNFTNAGSGTPLNGYVGGNTFFYDFSTAGNGTFINNGGTARGALGGVTIFSGTSTAANATLIANGGSGEGGGGSIEFLSNSSGGTARVEVFGNGNLDVSFHSTAGVTVGSIEGDGLVFLGRKNLTVGSNDLSTNFSGVISDHQGVNGRGGSLTKIGTGKLVLSHRNTYTGGTIVKRGRLVVNNIGGSGTGSGPVEVNGGRLAGNGTIAGAVTVGSGLGREAVLSPGYHHSHNPGTLTIQSPLIFNSDATYEIEANSSSETVDKVVALGVTINAGAQTLFADLGSGTFTVGSFFTVIDNTSATPIAGTFSNLPDGSTFTNNGNTYEVNYEGGDGNDLTLTVVP
jgi:autotransporter-associated beta strand protein